MEAGAPGIELLLHRASFSIFPEPFDSAAGMQVGALGWDDRVRLSAPASRSDLKEGLSYFRSLGREELREEKMEETGMKV